MQTKIFLLATLLLTLGITSTQAQTKKIAYQDDTAHLEGQYLLPRSFVSGKTPGILILPAWMGITPHETETAERLSKLGYVALVADIYGSKIHPTTPQEAGKLAGYYKKNYAIYQKRIKAALNQLIALGADKNKIAAIGYCFGGTGALEMARVNMPVRGVVSFHGGLDRDSSRPIGLYHPKILVLHGADDPYNPQNTVLTFQQELKKAKADWQMVYFAHAVHSFTDKSAGNDNSKGAAYNHEADMHSWEYMKSFLREVLR